MVTARERAVVAVVTVATLAGCSALVPTHTPVPVPTNRVIQIDQSAVPAGVVSYGEIRQAAAYGASIPDTPEVHTADDLHRLKDAPTSFTSYLRTHLEELSGAVLAELAADGQTVESEGCDYIVEISVWGVAPRVATGRERGCDQGSYDVIWVQRDGVWDRVARMDGGWDCAVLQRYQVPAELTASTCWYSEFRSRVYTGPKR